MAYVKTNWINNSAPARNASNLNKQEQGISDAHQLANIAQSGVNTNTPNIATNTSNIATNTPNIATNTSNIAINTFNIATNTFNIDTNTSDIATNTSDIATNTSDIASLSSNENMRGAWNPTAITEYPTDAVLNDSWYISGVIESGYLYTTGDLIGLMAQNMDKIILTSIGWSLISNNLTVSIPNLAIGRTTNPLCKLNLKNKIDLQGVDTPTFTRATEGNREAITSGLIETMAIDASRFETDGLKIEPASTNVCLWSDDLTNALWTKQGTTTVTLDAVLAPDGVSQSNLVTYGTDNNHVNQVISNSSDLVDSSIYFKQGTADYFAFSTIEQSTFKGIRYRYHYATKTLSYLGSGTTIYEGSVEELNDGWFRMEIKTVLVDFPHTEKKVQIYMSDINEGETNYVWRVQIEESYYKTSDIKTEDAPVTRAEDVLSMISADNFPNISKGFTIKTVLKPNVAIDTISKWIWSYFYSWDNYIALTIFNEDMTIVVAKDGVSFATTLIKYNNNEENVVVTRADESGMMSIFLNGEFIIANNYSTVLDVKILSDIYFGKRESSQPTVFNGHIKTFETTQNILTNEEIRLW